MTDHICAASHCANAPFCGGGSRSSRAALLTGVLVVSILWLFYAGVGIWGIDWPVAWGFAIINYVWWIAIASGGTFISALFFLTRSEWRNSINRIAETMTLFGAGLRRNLSDPASRPAVVVLLAVSLPRHDGSVAAVSQSVAVGFLRHPDLCHFLRAVLVSRPAA